MKAKRHPAHAIIPASATNVSGTATPDLSTGLCFPWTLIGNLTIANPTSPPAAGRGELVFILTQDGTGGRTVSWGTQFAGPIPPVDQTANAITVIRFLNISVGVPQWYCVSSRRATVPTNELALPVVKATKTTAPAAFTATTWTVVDATLDLVVPAATGDVVQLTVAGMCDNGAPNTDMDMGTMVSGAVVNRVSGAATFGITGWAARGGAYVPFGGTWFYTIVAGDVSGGNVTFRLLALNETAGTRNFVPPLQVAAMNFRH